MKKLIMYSVFQMFKNIKTTVITLVMVIVAFCVMGYAVLDYYEIRAGEYYAESIMNYRTDEVYKINIDKYIMGAINPEILDKVYNFSNDVMNMDGLENCGMYNAGGEYEDEELTEVCYYGDVLGIYGVDIEKLEESENTFILSSNPEIYGAVVDLKHRTVIDMEGHELQKLNMPSCFNAFYFTVSEGYDIEQVKREIYDIAKIYDVDISGIATMQQLFDVKLKMTLEEIGQSYLMPFVMIVAAVLGMIMSSLISLRVNRKDTGIMIANGMTVKEVCVIYYFENIIKVVIGVIVTILYCEKKNEIVYREYNEPIERAGITLFIIAIAVLAFSNLASRDYFKKRTPCALIGESND